MDLYQRVAYALAASNVVGAHMTWGEIVDHLRMQFHSQDSLQIMAETVYNEAVLSYMKLMGERESYPTFDEWLDEGYRIYMDKVGH